MSKPTMSARIDTLEEGMSTIRTLLERLVDAGPTVTTSKRTTAKRVTTAKRTTTAVAAHYKAKDIACTAKPTCGKTFRTAKRAVKGEHVCAK